MSLAVYSLSLQVAFVVAVVLSAHASASAHTTAAPSPPTFSAAYSAWGTYVLGDEGVVVNSSTLFNGTIGVERVRHSTANGYMEIIAVADTLNVTNGRLYYVYDISGSTTCYAFQLTIPVPLPAPSLAAYKYIRPGRSAASGVWGLNIGRMKIRMEGPFTLQAGSELHTTNDVGCDGSTHVSYTPSVPSTPVVVPPACAKASVAAYAHSWGGSALRVPLGAEHVSAERHRHIPPSKLYHPHVSVLPNEIDNRLFATPARNQGKVCGGCWAFSTCAAVEIAYNKWRNVTNPLVWFAPQHLIDCVHGNLNGTALIDAKGCLGGWPLTAMDSIVRNGLASETNYPFDGVTGSRCSPPVTVTMALRSYAAVGPPAGPSNIAAMQKALVDHGAFVAIINAPQSFCFWGGGDVYDDPTCTPSLQHAVTVVGYGTDKASNKDYWIIKNSFGASWGENGYIRMVRGKNMCGIENFAFIPIV